MIPYELAIAIQNAISVHTVYALPWGKNILLITQQQMIIEKSTSTNRLKIKPSFD